MSEKRKNIPSKIAAEIQYLSDLQCVVCSNGKRGVHIHHLDGYSNLIQNLVYLCFDCHDDASKTGSLKRKLSKEAIVKFRDTHYEKICINREIKIQSINQTMPNLNEEALLKASLNAQIILELDRSQEKYFDSKNADERSLILEKIFKYSKHTNGRLAIAMFDFMGYISLMTRAGMNANQANLISSLILSFLPYSEFKNDKNLFILTSELRVEIGYNIVYDAFTHLKDHSVSIGGFSILKSVYRDAINLKNDAMQIRVNEIFDELLESMNRPERDDLKPAKELIEIYKENLKEKTMRLPEMSIELLNLIHPNNN